MVAELPCDADKVDPCRSVIETESDEARFSGYACSYKDGEALDDMIQDEMVWDEFISSLSRDAETGHVQEEQVDEIVAYGVGCEYMVIEDATIVELSKNMVGGPWDLEQVIFVEPKEEHSMDAGGLAKEVEDSVHAQLAGILTYKVHERDIKVPEVKSLPLPPPKSIPNAFTLFFDGAFRKATGKARGGLVLLDPNGEVGIKEHVRLLGSMSNNETKYDILLHGLHMCLTQKIQCLMVKGDALLIVKQILGIWACKNERLRQKVHAIRRLFNKFEEVQLSHIPRKQNEDADLLAQKAIACVDKEVQIIMAGTVVPRYQGMESLALIISYILEGVFSPGFTKAQKQRLIKKASSYLFLEGALYQRGKDQVCRRIPTTKEIPAILKGLHEEACGGHFAQELTVKKVLVAGFGTPLKIVFDNGPRFRKGFLTEVFEELHILHQDSTPYYPQSNGLVEKANGIIAGIIRKMVKKKAKLWEDFLDGTLWAYRTIYREATKFTPIVFLCCVLTSLISTRAVKAV
ncbi:hypothetical protein L7F22_049051 [Adiantum nelumboides]|nr:hypothetical protein [Adiantum nelumboides]